MMLALPALAGCVQSPAAPDGDDVLLCSFYPVYVTALNVAGGVPGLSVRCMAPAQAGCLLDYQLTTADRKAVAGCDALLVNGLGMETFLPALVNSKGKEGWAVIDLSDGLSYDLIDWGGEGEHEGGQYNPHVWVSPAGAAGQAIRLGEALAARYPQHAPQLRENAAAYSRKLTDLMVHMKEALLPAQGLDIVTFHEAFPYLARDLSLGLTAALSQEETQQASAADIARIVSLARAGRVAALFTEPDAPGSASAAVAAETGMPLYELDPITRHAADGDPDGYLIAQARNLETLQKALLPKP